MPPTAPCSDDEIRRGRLLIRSRPDDTVLARPLPPDTDVEASPDLMLRGGQGEAGALEGVQHQVLVRVTNGGNNPLEGISVEAFVCDRTVGPPPLGQLDPPGRMTGFLGGPLEPGGSAVIACSPRWTPTGAQVADGLDGLCVAANAFADTPSDGTELTGTSVLKPRCDTHHHGLRAIVLQRIGTITTIAGTGEAGFDGEGTVAAQSRLDRPFGVAVRPTGEILIADAKNNRVRQISRDGRITTVAGTGERGFSGDGGPAVAARLSAPAALSMRADGGFLIAESGNHCVREVSADGRMIRTVAGTGAFGFGGDGGPATGAIFVFPQDVEALPDGAS